MKKAYVIGKNASKSLSPTIFNYWFKKYNIEGEYGFKEIDEKAKKNFRKVLKYKPISSKKESKEIYIYCKGILKI